jgi:hypothetical protein
MLRGVEDFNEFISCHGLGRRVGLDGAVCLSGIRLGLNPKHDKAVKS